MQTTRYAIQRNGSTLCHADTHEEAAALMAPYPDLVAVAVPAPITAAATCYVATVEPDRLTVAHRISKNGGQRTDRYHTLARPYTLSQSARFMAAIESAHRHTIPTPVARLVRIAAEGSAR